MHVSSGDAMAAVLREAFPDDRVLPWREALCDGPAPAGVEGEAWIAARAEWLAEEYGLERADVLADLRRQENALGEAIGSRRAVVLWFGRDLFCQANMLHAAWKLRALGKVGLLSLVLVDERSFDADAARTRLPETRPLTPEQSAWLSEARTAYGSSSLDGPTGLRTFISNVARQTDRSAIPETLAALRLHLERFPAMAGGLGRPESSLLRLLAQVDASPATERATQPESSPDSIQTPEDGVAFGDLFRRFGRAEPELGFGDWQVWNLLRRLAGAPSPLVAADPAPLAPGRLPPAPLAATRFRITPAGRSALARS